MKIVIIGSGIAGFSAASEIRRLSEKCEITMITKDSFPLYSPCVLPNYIASDIGREKVFLKDMVDYKDLGLRILRESKVELIDASAKRVFVYNGKSYSYDSLILASGSDSVTLGEWKKGMFKLKSLSDADEIISHKGIRAVVVGSGAIGVESAIALHRRGYKVVLIDMSDRVLPLGLDDTAAKIVAEILNNSGIEVATGERVIRVIGRQHVEGVVTNERQISCDTLVWAIGMRPNVDLAREAGVELGLKGGIQVSCNMETNISDIYACGDCAETKDILTGQGALNLFWHNANRQGKVAAQNCMGIKTSYRGSENILNVDVFGNQVISFGCTETFLNETLGAKPVDISILEDERNMSYRRLVIFRDRCMGAQFINLNKDLGLVRNIMNRKRSVEDIINRSGNKEIFGLKPWLGRIKPYFQKQAW